MAGFDQYRFPRPLPPFKTLKKKNPPGSTFSVCRPHVSNPNCYQIDTTLEGKDPLAISILSDVVAIISGRNAGGCVTGTLINSHLTTINLDAASNIQSVPKPLQGEVQTSGGGYQQNPLPPICPNPFYGRQQYSQELNTSEKMTRIESWSIPEHYSGYHFMHRPFPSSYNQVTRLSSVPYPRRRALNQVRGGWYASNFVSQDHRLTTRCPCPQCYLPPPPHPHQSPFSSQQMWPNTTFCWTPPPYCPNPPKPQTSRLCECGCGTVLPYPAMAGFNSQVWKTSKSENHLWVNTFGGSTMSQREMTRGIILPPIHFGSRNSLSETGEALQLQQIHLPSNNERESSSSSDFFGLDTFPVPAVGAGTDLSHGN